MSVNGSDADRNRGLREVLADLIDGPVPEGLSTEELKQQIQARLMLNSPSAAGTNGTPSVFNAIGRTSLLPPVSDRDDESTENALRTVAGILGQTGKVVSAALKQAKGRSTRLQDGVASIEQMLQREDEVAADATNTIRLFFKDLHEALTAREEELVQEVEAIREKEKQRVEDRLEELKAEDSKLANACNNVEKLLSGELSSSIGKLDAFNSPLEGLLEAMDSANRVLDKDGKKVSPMVKGEPNETLSFILCNDATLMRTIESLQITSFVSPHRDARGRITGRGGKVILMGTPSAVSREAQQLTGGMIAGGAMGEEAYLALNDGASAVSNRSVIGSDVGQRNWELDEGSVAAIQENALGAKRSPSRPVQKNNNSDTNSESVAKVLTIIPYVDEETDLTDEPRGLVHWLGTHGEQDEFSNPALFAPNDPFLVVLRASSRIEGELASVTGREHRRGTFFETDSSLSSWVALELPEGLWLRPDYYSMSYYIEGDEHIPRNWVLQGSPHGSRWTTLRIHENDTTLDEPPHIGAWSLSSSSSNNRDIESASGEPKGAYRFFRITQTGPTSSGTLFLILSGIEFYGTLFSMS